jgi:hypothetical protein
MNRIASNNLSVCILCWLVRLVRWCLVCLFLQEPPRLQGMACCSQAAHPSALHDHNQAAAGSSTHLPSSLAAPQHMVQLQEWPTSCQHRQEALQQQLTHMHSQRTTMISTKQQSQPAMQDDQH